MDSMFSIKRIFKDEEYREMVLTVISGVFLIISWFGWLKDALPFDAAWVSIIISGTPLLREAATGLLREFDLKAGVLVSIALIASVAIGEYFAAGEIAFIMMIGEMLEERTVNKARASIKKLIQLTPQTARIRTTDGEKEISAEEVRVGDIILVKPGEAIPVDGIIIKGQTTVNQSIITGESMPIDKTTGDDVYVGTMNQLGAVEIQASKVGSDTSLAKLIRLVRESEEKKAPTARIADNIATFIVPLALILSVVTYLFTQDIIRAVTILVVFCPCALVLSTPTAIMAGIGNASRKGILIKSGEALETVGEIDAIAFDKTGTFTYGKPEVTEIISLSQDYDNEKILGLASRAEKFSEHPLGKAVYAKAIEKSISVHDPEDFKMELGQGVVATVDQKRVIVGNTKLLALYNTLPSEDHLKSIAVLVNQGKTVLIVAVENTVIGLITVADKIKNNARETVRELKKAGIKEIHLLTGDNKKTAFAIAEQLGINSVYAEQLPEDKAHVIAQILKENKKIAMIGDGINDAPALAVSNVGVAMGALGTDIAIETADVALMTDDISKVPELIKLSKKVLQTIKFNIAASMVINFVAILLAALGILNPVVGALVHNLGSVLVVANSSRLIKYNSTSEPLTAVAETTSA